VITDHIFPVDEAITQPAVPQIKEPSCLTEDLCLRLNFLQPVMLL
jgi:hypothetical protein